MWGYMHLKHNNQLYKYDNSKLSTDEYLRKDRLTEAFIKNGHIREDVAALRALYLIINLRDYSVLTY